MKKLVVTLFLVLIAILSCGKKKGDPLVIESVVPAPAKQNRIIEDANGLSPTLYFIPILDTQKLDCGAEARQSIKNIQGDIIAQMCDSDYKVCLYQGTCLLSESNGLRMINFTTRRGKIPLFSDKIKKECPYGLGLKNICLDPYYTLAGDLNFHKLGDVVFIPSVRGLKLPNGQTHDGYFIIRDSGSNLKSEKRFDFFTGFDNESDITNVFNKLGLNDKENRFVYKKVGRTLATKVRIRRNYPRLNSKQRQEAAQLLKKIIRK